ncbi:molybdopterin-guanine dinucleotide biosynthesis protein A [Ureibacillus xyleni]|uniref:Probable molybdenum cofactor guanylyltransferase n=2 Tax=Ureibacillus xyleni TaxID=614648 RepID=A0A285RZ70_9BACL|nr:molybdopterin-guanine dinucleotide biosynthesis protein A [Ureibacillus xyleni]
MIGVILAGGESRRFGSPKAFAKIGDQYFYEIAYKNLEPVCQKVIIVTRDELLPLFPSHLLKIVDTVQFKGNGPLAGIYSAMIEELAEQYMVLPCDMPFLNRAILQRLCNVCSKSMVVAVRNEQHLYPLVGIWNRSVINIIYDHLQNNEKSVLHLLKKIDTTWVEAEYLTKNPSYYFQNLNQPLEERSE